MLINTGWRTLHYLDNFFTVLESESLAQEYEEFFTALCIMLGLKIKESKNIRSTLAEFLGIKIDTLAIEARLPERKLSKAKEWVKTTLQQKQISREDLCSLLGFLSFAAKVVVLGRIFLRQLFNALSKYQKVYHLSAGMTADLMWWDKVFFCWNGVRILQHVEARHQIHLWTDVSSLFGIGGYYLKEDELIPSTLQAFSERLYTKHRGKHITVKETMAVLHALQKWTQEFKKARLIIHGDNTGVVNGLKSLAVCGPALDLLQNVIMILALQDIIVESYWLSSEDNSLADILSRGQWSKLANNHQHLQEIFPNYFLN